MVKDPEHATWTQRLKAALDSETADLWVRMLSFAFIIAVCFLAVQQHRQRDCFERYAEKAAIAANARFEAFEIDRSAEDKLYQTIVANPRKAFDALAEYNIGRIATDRQRAENPPPPPPSAFC